MASGISRLAAAVLTLGVIGGLAYWAWTGLKQPPVHAPTVAIVTTPPGWQRIDQGQFTFYAPPGTRLRQAKSGDLVYGDIIGPNTCLRFQLGPHTRILADRARHRDFSEGTVAVDGRSGIVRKAVLFVYERQQWFGECGGPLYIGYQLPQAVRGTGAAPLELAVEGAAMNDDERDQQELVFKSIRFARAP